MEVISIIVALISFLLGSVIIHKFVIPINKRPVHFANWYYFFEFGLMSFLAIFLLSDNPNLYWGLQSIAPEQFESVKITVNFFLAWIAIAFPLGMLLSDKLFKKLNLKNNILEYYNKPMLQVNRLELILLLFSLIFTSYIIYKIGFIPQLKMFSLTKLEAAQLRNQLTFNFPANVHLKELVGMHLIIIFCFSSYLKLLNKKTYKNVIIFSLFLLMSMFFVSINLNKSGIAFLLIGLVFCYTLENNIGFKAISLTIISLIVLMISSYYVTYKKNPINLLLGIKNRIIYSQTFGNYLSVYYFPKKIEYIGLSSISRTIEKLGFEYKENSAKQIMNKIKKDEKDKKISGYMVSHYMAEAWANFGIFGVILSPLYIGFLIKSLLGIIINQRRTPLFMGLFVFISYKLATISGFNHILIPRYLIIIFIIFFIIEKFLNKGELKS